MSKQVLIESGFISNLKISNELKESLSLSAGKGDTLVVKNVPCTILNRKNQNGRIYTTQELQHAITEAKEQIITKQLLCQADEHPEGSFVAPTHASHVVTNAYIKQNVEVLVEGQKGRFDVLFMDWEVLDTEEGNNLKGLLKAECSLGTSIRGVGDMEGDKVINYELLGCDVVSNPSSGTFTRMPIQESVVLDIKKANEMKEAFTVEAETVDSLGDINQAAELLHRIGNDHSTTLSKSSVKFDSEVNPDTGAETNVAILTTNTSDDVDDLQTALQMAGKKMSNPIGTTDSVTISRIEDEDADANDGKESVAEPVDEDPLMEDSDAISYDGDKKIAVDFGDGNQIEKEFDKPEQASIAMSGIENGTINPDMLADGEVEQVQVEASQDEMLVSGKDQASDPEVQVKLNEDDDKEVLYTYEATDLDFDLPEEEEMLQAMTGDELLGLADQLPDMIKITTKMPKKDAENYEKVLEKLSDEYQIPLKSAHICMIKCLDDKEDSEEKSSEKEESSMNMTEKLYQKPYWRGIEGIYFIFNGSYSDPELAYKGYTFNYYDIEDGLWAEFLEEHPEYTDSDSEDPACEAAFTEFLKVNAPLYLDDLIAEGVYDAEDESEEIEEAKKSNKWDDPFGFSKAINWGRVNAELKDPKSPIYDILNQIDANKKKKKEATLKEYGSQFDNYDWQKDSGFVTLVQAVQASCNIDDPQEAWMEIVSARQSAEENAVYDGDYHQAVYEALDGLGLELDYAIDFLNVPCEEVEPDDDDDMDESCKQEANEYGENKFTVYFWPFAGYSLYPVKVEAFSEEEALEKAVAQLEKEGKFGFFADDVENPDDDETLLYVDATEFGGGVHYISVENLKIEEGWQEDI